ncbi:class II glutamine amidotransferase [Microlunatus soli]|uniref:Predicted glutamine amidotransferase n=1 Tax=Microlunatus soli TaxID=630515 RepID=A0A1H1U277_9ACTN|nr:class II glutamine amidotransferase [Microlunatus soli]SDS66484.1 Predicted glutamine amidotransferase [Microlunatus soli]
MCRLLGRVSRSLSTDADLIGVDGCAEFQRLGRLHADGWGTAWLTDGPDGTRLGRLRDPGEPTAATDLTGALTRTPSRARITHLRLATEGLATQVSNTHPFLADGIAFAHNGSVPVAPLRELVTADELNAIGGDTDSAMIFALVLRRVRRGEPLFDAVIAVVAELRDRFGQAALNLLLLSERELIAAHANEGARVPHEDFVASGLGADLPADHVDHYYRMSWRRTDDGLVITSSGLPSDGWMPLQQHTAARVDCASLELELRSIRGSRAGDGRSDAA